MKKVFVLLLALILLSGCTSAPPQASAPATEAPTQAIVEPPQGRVPSEDSYFEITYLDVGQADAALIICDGVAMLIDGGNAADSDLIYAFLGDKGIDHIDYIICTHAHEDHCGGLAGALHAASVSHVYCPVSDYNSKAFRNFVKAAEEQGLTLEKPEVGSVFALGCADVYVLGPLKEYPDANNTSIILGIVYSETSFLFTGDMERAAELDLIDAGVYLKSDVLKVAHHGSFTSSSYVFIYEVEPKYAVISCGKGNSYGHPHEEVLSRLRDADVQVFRTDWQGHITCTSDGKTISFSTERNADIITNPTA